MEEDTIKVIDCLLMSAAKINMHSPENRNVLKKLLFGGKKLSVT